jgi:hypothetical protein
MMPQNRASTPGQSGKGMLAQNWPVSSRDALISLKRRRQAVVCRGRASRWLDLRSTRLQPPSATLDSAAGLLLLHGTGARLLLGAFASRGTDLPARPIERTGDSRCLIWARSG